jgi:tetratricopeptide (TPR) repeat protein
MACDSPEVGSDAGSEAHAHDEAALGAVHFDVSCSEEVSEDFNAAVAFLHHMQYVESSETFEQIAEADPGCAMAHWGVAYALGPNYNLPWHLYDPEGRAQALAGAYDATQLALSHVEDVTPVEQALIRALPARYPQRDPLDDLSPWNKDFTDVMRKIYAEHPGDLEVQTVFAEAIMNETPWQMWDLKTGGVAEGAGTVEAREILETAFREIPASWDHPGLLHLYVHLMEMSPFPELALRAGDRLREIMPDGGHLIHMPTHIDVLCGNYRDVVVYNQKAIIADRKYLERAGALNVYSMYRTHNHHFAIYGAMFLGQFTPAIEAAQELIDTTPEDLVRMPSPPMADFIEGYLPMKQHVLIRFGKWQEIIDQDLPENQELYCSTTAMMLYAKSVAHSAMGNVAEAERDKAAFLEAKTKVPESRRVHNNTVQDLLEIAGEMLNGELEYRRGNYDVAFANLRKSVELDDALPYDEPWGWMQPTRHALGALLLEQNQLKEAEAVYREDLGLDQTLSRACQHPNNLWSLHGLHECLTRRGEKVESVLIKQQLDQALARAEVQVHASCYCRQKAAA